MNKEELMKGCEEVFGFFNNDANLHKFIDTLAGEDELDKFLTESQRDAVFAFSSNDAAIAFSMGYALGQIVDVLEPNIQKAVEVIQGTFKDANFLPYLPRKKAA